MPHIKYRLLLCTLALLLIFPLFSACAGNPDLDDVIEETAAPFRFRLFNWEVKTLAGMVFGSGDDTDNAVLDAGLLEARVREAFASQGIYNPVDRFFTLKFSFPPVSIYLGQLPRLLIVSPRDRIENIREAILVPDMTVADMGSIEAEIESLGYSALVDNLGGLSTFPSFIADDADIRFIVDTAAHEWLHLYLTFTPLGFVKLLDTLGIRQDYDVSTMNETIADIIGREIGAMVYEKYYASPSAAKSPPPPDTGGSSFDFNKEMREIRLAVDNYLAGGEVDKAEKYMAEKRQYLEDNGYYLRKLNQAYFAFHGTYADSPTSVSPIGEELRTLRANSETMKDFLDTVAAMSSREDLAARAR
jgi:hypothetical protein